MRTNFACLRSSLWRVDTNTVWWLWLQEWIVNNEARLDQNPNAKTILLHVSIGQTLDKGLDTDLQRITAGSSLSAMGLALRNIIEAASD